MSLTLFEWDRYVGTHMTPVDAVHSARAAGKTFNEYASEYAAANPSEEITVEELTNGMVSDMVRAAHNLATFRVTGSPTLSPYSAALFMEEPDDPENYYAWIETVDESEIVEKVRARETT